MAQAGSIMLAFRMAYGTSYFSEDIIFASPFLFLNIYQNNNKIVNGYPPISCQIPPISGCSDWLGWCPHKRYRVYV